MKSRKKKERRRIQSWPHLCSQFLHVGVDVVQQAVALLEERVLRVHEGQHLGDGQETC